MTLFRWGGRRGWRRSRGGAGSWCRGWRGRGSWRSRLWSTWQCWRLWCRFFETMIILLAPDKADNDCDADFLRPWSSCLLLTKLIMVVMLIFDGTGGELLNTAAGGWKRGQRPWRRGLNPSVIIINKSSGLSYWPSSTGVFSESHCWEGSRREGCCRGAADRGAEPSCEGTGGTPRAARGEKTHHRHHHSAIITMIDHNVQNDKNNCQVVGREREEWAGEREASAHLIQVGWCQFSPSNCQHIVNMSALGTRFSWL